MTTTSRLYLRDATNQYSWRNLTHAGDACALAGWSLSWGTSNGFDQPEPSVLTFTLLDRTGDLIAAGADLTGRVIRLQWSQPRTTSELFVGIITSGMQADKERDGWRIRLTATAKSVLWKRLRDEGPHAPTTYGQPYQDTHWNLTPSDNLAEMNRRAKAAGAPTVDTTNVTYAQLGNVSYDTPVEAGSYPSQWTLLHEYYTSAKLPLWYEYCESQYTQRLRPVDIITPAEIAVDGECRLFVCDPATFSDRHYALDAAQVVGELQYTLSEPYTKVVFQGKSFGYGPVVDGKTTCDIGDGEITTTVTDLPAALQTTEKSITIPCRHHIGGGGFTGWGAWTLSDDDLDALHQCVKTVDTRFTPSRVTFDSRTLDPEADITLYRPEPLRYLAFHGTSTPFDATGPYMTIGGVLSFDWLDDEPHITHDVTLWPMTCPNAGMDNTTTWAQITNWTPTYSQGDITISDFTKIQTFYIGA